MNQEMMEDPVITWIQDREETIKELRRLGKKIKYHATNAQIASAVGGGTSIVSGIGAVVCCIASPLTAGASLVGAAAFSMLAFAGGGTTIGAMAANYFIQKGYTETVQNVLDKDRESFEKMKTAVKEAKQIKVETGNEGTFQTGRAGINVRTSVARRLDVSENAATSLLKLGQTTRFVSNAVFVVTLPLNIVDFVTHAIDVAKGNFPAAAERVFELADQLQKECDEIMANAE